MGEGGCEGADDVRRELRRGYKPSCEHGWYILGCINNESRSLCVKEAVDSYVRGVSTQVRSFCVGRQ